LRRTSGLQHRGIAFPTPLDQAGQEYDRDVLGLGIFLQVRGNLCTVHIWHQYVKNDKVRMGWLQQLSHAYADKPVYFHQQLV
jgi:hypothetical protein